MAGSVRFGDRRFSFNHRGDDFYRHHYDHWVFQGSRHRYGYQYPHYSHYGYPYPRYRHYSPYHRGYYSPYAHYQYLPYWYTVPTFGYTYVSAYYDAGPVGGYATDYGTVDYADEPAGHDGSVVIYGAESVYVDGGRVAAEEPYSDTQPYVAEPSYEPAPMEAYPDRDPTDVRPHELTPEAADEPQPGEVREGEALPPAGAEGEADASEWGPVLDEGNLAFAKGDYATASEHYRRVVNADESDGYARMLLAWSKFAERSFGEAASAMQRALETTPDLVDYPIDVRVLYEDQQAFVRQLTDLRNYVLAEPGGVDATFVLAYAHYSIGEPGKAVPLFQALVAADPEAELFEKLEKAALRGQEILRSRSEEVPTGGNRPE